MTIIKLTITVLLVMVSFSIFSQEVSPKAQELLDARLNDMTEVMDLDKSQQAKVKELNIAVHFKRQDVRQLHERGSDELKNANKAITQQYYQDLRAFCSNEQMKALFAHNKKKQANKKKK